MTVQAVHSNRVPLYTQITPHTHYMVTRHAHIFTQTTPTYSHSHNSQVYMYHTVHKITHTFTQVHYAHCTLYTYNVYTVTIHVLYMYCTCTVHVLYMYCTCTVHVLYMYYTVTIHVQYM